MRRAAQIIKEAITCREYLQSVGVAVDRSGFSVCPLHGDRQGSLKVYSDPLKGWHCFGCGKGGSVIDLCMEYEGITFRQAITRLSTLFGVLVAAEAPKSARLRRLEEEKAMQRRATRAAAEKASKWAEIAFWLAYDDYLYICQQLDDNRPKKPTDGFTSAYAAALWMLPIVRDEFEWRLYKMQQAKEGGAMIGGSQAG